MKRTRRRRCPRCERLTPRSDCCGLDLTVRRKRFRMTAQLLALVHTTVAQKGLDEETYRLRLGAGFGQAALDQKGIQSFFCHS